MKPMMIIFGATGDLTKRKLIPALFRLHMKKTFTGPILAIGRRNLNQEEYIESLETTKFIGSDNMSNFLKKIAYQQFDFKNIEELFDKILKTDKKYKINGNLIFYLATPAFLFDKITSMLKGSSVLSLPGFKRVVYEKPFGHNLASAKELNNCINKAFKERQIYRIDHYLGKELVQNILVFRFANSILNEIWHNKFIDHIQITISETLGVQDRAGYYEKSGVVRDMLQNHLMQLLTLTTMKPPKDISASSIRNSKIKALSSIKTLTNKDYVLGQYSSGKIDGESVKGYLDEKDIAKSSKTPTFVAARFYLKNKQWKGVPIIIRTGKRMEKKLAQINVVLKDVSCNLFCKDDIKVPNIITIKIQPNEGLEFTLAGKTPGSELEIAPIKMDFCHECTFGSGTPEAYEMLLHQILNGDQTLFTSFEEVKTSWKIIEPMLKKNKPEQYMAGSNGPTSADELLPDGREWC